MSDHKEAGLNITKRDREDVAILDVRGKLSGSVGDGSLPEVVLRSVLADEELAEAANRRILLNLADCTGADSLGIGELISLYVSTANRGGTLKLLNLPELVRENLTATQLIGMFEIFDDEEAAVASFS